MKSPLIRKTFLLIMCIAIVIGVLAIAIYNKGLYDAIILQYKNYSVDITKLVASEIDPERLSNVKNAVIDIYDRSENKVMSDQWGTPEFESYMSRFETVKEMDDYKTVLADLQKMQDEINVDCLYIAWIDKVNECYVYLIDAAHEDPCPPGCIDPVFLEDAGTAVNNLSAGMRPNITKTPEYGWLISTGMPIYDDRGEIVAMAAADISMSKAMSELTHFMGQIGIVFSVMIILVCILSIFLIGKYIVMPINALSRAALDYKNNRSVFSELKLEREDEIGILAKSMVQMEKDINRYVSDLISTREYADRMDRAAKIDALTRVLNKRAYDIEAKRLDKSKQPYGIILIDMNGLKGINDKYGHAKGDISIKTVCNIICDVFGHSSVYRIGGDEFVVILENKDYEDRDALIHKVSESFRSNKSNSSLQPWERVSAAVGCAVYEPKTNESAESVLQRADAAMYENKKL
ncbi:MAG: diguanylate cyclase [Clostridia bacterium]|nr:diguanylate cyclase [Clostridia bacterium]